MGAPAQGYTDPRVSKEQQIRDNNKDILLDNQMKALNALIAHLQLITDEEHIVGLGDEIDGSN